MSTYLDQLAQVTTVVSDSGDFGSIAEYKPTDATTNPSLILAAVKDPKYDSLTQTAIKWAKEKGGSVDEQVDNALDRLLVEYGRKILEIVPKRVSTEVDARFSFDKQRTIDKALQIIKLYEEVGVSRDRILIKIASSWEGIQAARELQSKHQINCNLTLLFGFAQAVACAEAGVTLISPFVGRILDWYKSKEPNADFSGPNDPGVKSVQKIYAYYKQHGYNTTVMGASFRNVGEIKELAGIDYLTIAPALLKELKVDTGKLDVKLSVEGVTSGEKLPKVTYVDNEAEFRWALLEDQMAFDKLHEGIKKFAADAVTLKGLLKKQIEA